MVINMSLDQILKIPFHNQLNGSQTYFFIQEQEITFPNYILKYSPFFLQTQNILEGSGPGC